MPSTNISTKNTTALHLRSQKRALIEKLVEGIPVLYFTYSNCLSNGVNVIFPVQWVGPVLALKAVSTGYF